MKRLGYVLVFCPWIFLAPGAIGREEVRADRPRPAAAVSAEAEGPEVSVKVEQYPATPTVPVGQLVRLDATKSDAEALDWDCSTEGDFIFDIPPGQDRVAYLSIPIVGRHRIRVTGMKNGKDAPVFTSQVLYVVVTPRTTPTPPPNPNPPDPNPPPPDPTPPPNPDPIVTKYGLTQYTLDLVKKNVPPEKRLTCLTLAANYGAVVGMILQGTVKTPADANSKIKELNGKAIPTQAEKDFWQTAVFTDLNAKINSLGIKTIGETSQAFSEIGTGFALGSAK